MFERLGRAHPEIAEIHATIGAVRFQQGDFAGALKELQAAKRLKPGLPKLDGLIAMSQAEMGQSKEALPGLEATFRTATDEPVKRMSGLELERAYTAVHPDSDAVAVALELQRLFTNDPEVLYHNERIFGNFAYLTVARLAEVAPQSSWRHQAEAEAEESAGKHDAAIEAYRAVLAEAPNRHGIHYRIGRCLREKARESHHPEDLAAAMAEFQAELKIDPENANADYEIGELHRLAGELEPARTYFAAAVALYPDFPEANLGLGTVLASLGRPAEALAPLKLAVASDPGDEVSWYRLSQVERALEHKTEQEAALAEFFGPGDKLAATSVPEGSYAAQGFATAHGKKLLVINKRNREQAVTLPADAAGGQVALVAPSTGDGPPKVETLPGSVLTLQPFEVAVVTYR